MEQNAKVLNSHSVESPRDEEGVVYSQYVGKSALILPSVLSVVSMLVVYHFFIWSFSYFAQEYDMFFTILIFIVLPFCWFGFRNFFDVISMVKQIALKIPTIAATKNELVINIYNHMSIPWNDVGSITTKMDDREIQILHFKGSVITHYPDRLRFESEQYCKISGSWIYDDCKTVATELNELLSRYRSAKYFSDQNDNSYLDQI